MCKWRLWLEDGLGIRSSLVKRRQRRRTNDHALSACILDVIRHHSAGLNAKEKTSESCIAISNGRAAGLSRAINELLMGDCMR
jgi:hypothetical protein